MKRCEIKWLSLNEMEISGIVDEYADFSELAQVAEKILTVDFSGVTRMNSSGIRGWIQNVRRHKITLILKNCSSPVVEQFSMIPEFTGKNGFVESFFVHYHCVACEYETRLLLRIGIEIHLGDSPHIDQQLATPCPKCGETLDLDHNPEIYFSFLRPMKPQQRP